MTDLEEAVELEAGPELIATHYLTSIEDAVEHLRAASQLGLGVRLRTYLEPEDDGETLAERWELELLTSSPVHHDDAAPHEDAAAE
ncbi:hypothetical protein [Actinoplanes sp. N902-109]|uniref:hypothetical protein n=1 Tax=Actinoplanes sp. (strain N902-109) TaxID=649831 RepID=UPI0003293AF0|nr:hypothetical protein [Actinoplanes sp. N902-109]AGL17265.1 hypothetical protein L083_3755 [Actinoplanes sp. N902-109]